MLRLKSQYARWQSQNDTNMLDGKIHAGPKVQNHVDEDPEIEWWL